VSSRSNCPRRIILHVHLILLAVQAYKSKSPWRIGNFSESSVVTASPTSLALELLRADSEFHQNVRRTTEATTIYMRSYKSIVSIVNKTAGSCVTVIVENRQGAFIANLKIRWHTALLLLGLFKLFIRKLSEILCQHFSLYKAVKCPIV
jgi:hypothetical protein